MYNDRQLHMMARAIKSFCMTKIFDLTWLKVLALTFYSPMCVIYFDEENEDNKKKRMVIFSFIRLRYFHIYCYEIENIT